MKKRTIFLWIIPAAIVFVLAGAFIWFRVHPLTVDAGVTTLDTTQLKTTQVVVGSLSAAVGASGTVQSNQSAQLAWKTDGRVAQVLVKKGDSVQAGQIIAQLDPASSAAIVNAQADLLTTQVDLTSVQDVRVAQAQAQLSLANAQAAVTSAQNTLAAVQLPPTQPAIEAAYAVYLNDVSQVESLQKEYNHSLQMTPIIFYGHVFLSNEQIDLIQALDQASLSREQQQRDNDLAYYNSLLHWTVDAGLLKQDQNALAIAQQQLASAQSTVDKLKNGPDAGQVAADQAKLANDQATIDEQYVRAPFAGTVTDLSLKPGDLVKNGAYAVRVDDLSSLFVNLQVAEVDINSIAEGQSAALSFDGIPQKDYQAVVTAIAPSGTVSRGLTSFTVTLILQHTDALVKPGMTAEVTITTQTAQNSLIVPIHAITEKALVSISGNVIQEQVYVLRNGAAVPVTITGGVSSDTEMAVTAADLHAGDVLITNPAALPAAEAAHPNALITFLHGLGLVRYAS